MLKTKVVSVRDSLSEQAIAVRKALIDQGLETPMVENGLGDSEKRARIQAAMQQVYVTLHIVSPKCM